MYKFPFPLSLGTNPADGSPQFGLTIEDMFITEPTMSPCGRFEIDPMEGYGLTAADVAALQALNKALDDAAEAALNEGARIAQNAMGVTTGDFAGVYFSGDEHRGKLKQMFADYMGAELAAGDALSPATPTAAAAAVPVPELAAPKPASIDWNALADGTRARVRLGRHGRDKVDWEQVSEVTLFVQKDRKGKTCLVAVKERPDFAEFSLPHSLEEPNLLVSEDYLLEVRKLLT